MEMRIKSKLFALLCTCVFIQVHLICIFVFAQENQQYQVTSLQNSRHYRSRLQQRHQNDFESNTVNNNFQQRRSSRYRSPLQRSDLQAQELISNSSFIPLDGEIANTNKYGRSSDLSNDDQFDESKVHLVSKYNQNPVRSRSFFDNFQFFDSSTQPSSSSLQQRSECPSECSCDERTQIANCTSRGLTKVPSNFPKDIKRIYLQQNNISEVNAFAFKGLKRLQRIDLSHNNIMRLDSQAFAGGMSSLNSLLLYSNKLSLLPANVFDELISLQMLLLNTNSIQCIERNLFSKLTNLNLLSLHDNNIETLTDGTFKTLTNIKTL